MSGKVLFVCIHNSARSQMAEAFFNSLCGKEIKAESAGLEPGNLNPYVVKVMAEEGIDISGNKTKSVFDFMNQGRTFDYVVTVCNTEAAERCPIFPGDTIRKHWSFPDPSSRAGTDEEKLSFTRDVRDMIKKQIIEFIKEVKQEN